MYITLLFSGQYHLQLKLKQKSDDNCPQNSIPKHQLRQAKLSSVY